MSLIIKYFSITKALSDGINLYFKNLRLLFPVTAIIGLATLLIIWATLPGFPSPNFNIETTINKMRYTMSYSYNINSNLGTEHWLGIILLSIYKSFMINFCLKIYHNADNKDISFTEFWNLDFNMFSYLIARLRYIITSIAGLIFFVIPGLVWIPRYYFANYFVIDRKLNVGESFAASSALTYGIKRKLWLFLLTKGFIFNIFVIGFMPITVLLIYLVLYIPISVLAKISIYKQLLTPKQIA